MTTVNTTLKTETCSYSEYRIYPGRGIKFVSKDGKTHVFLNSKCDSLFHQRIKPVRLTWTQSWRRMNKKMRHQEGGAKKRTKRSAKVQKAIAGLSLDEMKKKHAMKKAIPGAKAAALKEARARQAARQEKSTEKTKVPKTTTARVNVPRNQPKVGKQQTSSGRR